MLIMTIVEVSLSWVIVKIGLNNLLSIYLWGVIHELL